MKKVIISEKKPIKLWLDDVESGALEQARNLANLSFTFKHVALMPDCHQGYGMPIGGVLATKGVVIPNAVGVDIGCGMCAVKTSFKNVDDFNFHLKKIMDEIRKAIPVGFSHHKLAQKDWLSGEEIDNMPYLVVDKEYGNSLTQLGTLGGGNHFIEIQHDSEGFVWIMIHSGSRNLGLKVAKHYNDVAKKLNDTWKSEVPPSYDLAFLPMESVEGKNYLREMNLCLKFALANREHMIGVVKNIFIKVMFKTAVRNKHPSKYFGDLINIHHNYATLENHFGENVVVHRKGATSARIGEVGIIPGSQGSSSYIVSGLGNRDSFESCSHGAGRKMGRKEAVRSLDFEKEVCELDKLGVVHSIKSVKDLDEAPGSYKDIDVVMDNQEDLVKILVKLTPLGVVKG